MLHENFRLGMIVNDLNFATSCGSVVGSCHRAELLVKVSLKIRIEVTGTVVVIVPLDLRKGS